MDQALSNLQRLICHNPHQKKKILGQLCPRSCTCLGPVHEKSRSHLFSLTGPCAKGKKKNRKIKKQLHKKCIYERIMSELL